MLMTLLNRFSKLMLDFIKNPFLVIFMFLVEMIDQEVKKIDKKTFQQPLAEFGIQPHFTAAQRRPYMPYFSVPPAQAFCHSFKQVCQCVRKDDDGQPVLSTIYIPM